jgi:hypothetical protein
MIPLRAGSGGPRLVSVPSRMRVALFRAEAMSGPALHPPAGCRVKTMQSRERNFSQTVEPVVPNRPAGDASPMIDTRVAGP